MTGIEGFILIGGASSRMGKDKAQLDLNGRSFVERIANALSAISDRITLVGRKETLPQCQLAAIVDIQPGVGALGGVQSSLMDCSSDWAAIVACDLPFVTRELFVRLSGLRENFDAVAPVQRDGRPQPLCALYRKSKCCRIAEEMIAAGERRPRMILQSVLTRWIRPEDLIDLARSELFFENLNTPQEYASAREKWQ